jgi:hypothetical protein
MTAIDDGLVARRFWTEVFDAGDFGAAGKILADGWRLRPSE